MTQKEGVTIELIGCLGGCSKQAASASGNPFRWLKSRVRRALSPSPGYGDKFYSRNCLEQAAESGSRELLKAAVDRLQKRLGDYVNLVPVDEKLPRRGRPRTRLTSQALAAFLNTKPGSNLLATFNNFIKDCVKQLRDILNSKLPESSSGLFRQALDAILDHYFLPFRPKDGCQPPPGEIMGPDILAAAGF